jgi:hypothetical protein
MRARYSINLAACPFRKETWLKNKLQLKSNGQKSKNHLEIVFIELKVQEIIESNLFSPSLCLTMDLCLKIQIKQFKFFNSFHSFAHPFIYSADQDSTPSVCEVWGCAQRCRQFTVGLQRWEKENC